MTKAKIGIVVALALGAAAAVWLQFEGSNGELERRFPEIDPKIVRKVHKEMLREALAGEYNNVYVTDEDYDELFRSKVWQHLN